MKDSNHASSEKLAELVKELHRKAPAAVRGEGDQNYVFEAVITANSTPPNWGKTEDFTGKDVPLDILKDTKTVKIHFYCGKLTVFFRTHSGKEHLITHHDSSVIQTQDPCVFRTGQPGILYTWKSSNLLMDERQGWAVLGTIDVTDPCKKIECGDSK